MRTQTKLSRAVRIAAMSIPLAAGSALAQNSYTLIDLGGPGYSSHAFALANSEGQQAVGSFYTLLDFNYFAFLAADAPTPLLPSETRHQSVAFDVSDAGLVLGASYNVGDLNCHAFLDDGVTQTDLGAFTPRAMNAQGLIGGTVNVATTPFGGQLMPRACRFSAGTLQALPTLGGSTGMGLTIDDLGRVAGSATTSGDAASRPCLWVGTTPIDLGTLGGQMGQVYALQGDTAVGLSTTAAGLMHATKWTLNGDGSVASRIDLGALSPTGTSVAHAINAAGDIVGTSNGRAVLWRNGEIIDLNTLAAGPYWVLANAWDIDSFGRIVGTGLHAGVRRAFVLLPGENCPPCPADFDQNGGITGDDVAGFFSYYERGWPCADINLDGGIDPFDIAAFFASWEAGGC